VQLVHTLHSEQRERFAWRKVQRRSKGQSDERIKMIPTRDAQGSGARPRQARRPRLRRQPAAPSSRLIRAGGGSRCPQTQVWMNVLWSGGPVVGHGGRARRGRAGPVRPATRRPPASLGAHTQPRRSAWRSLRTASPEPATSPAAARPGTDLRVGPPTADAFDSLPGRASRSKLRPNCTARQPRPRFRPGFSWPPPRATSSRRGAGGPPAPPLPLAACVGSFFDDDYDKDDDDHSVIIPPLPCQQRLFSPVACPVNP
jgi:hypothetical protein